jgi:hypothetical protein
LDRGPALDEAPLGGAEIPYLPAGDERRLSSRNARMLVPVEKPGLDDDKLSMLAKWAAGLRDDHRPEVAAAGRAIEMLIDEVERLNVLIWERRLGAGDTAGPAQIWQGARPGEATDAPPGDDVTQTLRERLRHRARSALNPRTDA